MFLILNYRKHSCFDGIAKYTLYDMVYRRNTEIEVKRL